MKLLTLESSLIKFSASACRHSAMFSGRTVADGFGGFMVGLTAQEGLVVFTTPDRLSKALLVSVGWLAVDGPACGFKIFSVSFKFDGFISSDFTYQYTPF